jgi:mRNA interferase MazF
MGLYAAGQVVFLPFPFSDLSRSKLRPVVFLAQSGLGEWIACQITSNPYIDPWAIPLDASGFRTGQLRQVSYIRPGKLFTAHDSLVAADVGSLTASKLETVRDAIVAIIREAMANR